MGLIVGAVFWGNERTVDRSNWGLYIEVCCALFKTLLLCRYIVNLGEISTSRVQCSWLDTTMAEYGCDLYYYYEVLANTL
jgi:hypothetical protein